jgi:hypothetical protein
LSMTIGAVAATSEPPKVKALSTIGRALDASALVINLPSPGVVLREVANLVAVALERAGPLPGRAGLLKSLAVVSSRTLSANVVLPARKLGVLLLKVTKVSGAGTGWVLTIFPLTILSWSFLAAEPLRPATLVSLLPLPPFMVVATKAAAAKHATTILRGVERVMVMVYAGSMRVSNGFGKIRMRTMQCWVKKKKLPPREHPQSTS